MLKWRKPLIQVTALCFQLMSFLKLFKNFRATICYCVAFINYIIISRGFKALKQTVKLYYKLGKFKEMMDSYREMLTYIKSAVTRNYSEKCINGIMDFVSGSASQNFSLLQEFYQTTLKALEEAKNEVRMNKNFWHTGSLFVSFSLSSSVISLRSHDPLFLLQRLWFKTNLKLCKIWFDMGEYGRMSKVSCLLRLEASVAIIFLWFSWT